MMYNSASSRIFLVRCDCVQQHQNASVRMLLCIDLSPHSNCDPKNPKKLLYGSVPFFMLTVYITFMHKICTVVRSNVTILETHDRIRLEYTVLYALLCIQIFVPGKKILRMKFCVVNVTSEHTTTTKTPNVSYRVQTIVTVSFSKWQPPTIFTMAIVCAQIYTR